jgi:ribosome-interacting GTPase 1
MPANLPPRYYEAEKKYRAARGPAERVAALQEMLSATPKHKGTDHLRAELRSKVARATEELERPRRGSGQPQPYAIRKEGVGQVVLIGLPNSGKSQLLAGVTGASAKVGDYSFTTQMPLPGMLKYQNVRIQLVDTPAINDREVQTRLFSLLRNADLLLVVLDLSGDPLSEAEEVLAELEQWGYRLLEKGQEPDPDDPRVQKSALLVGNKADVAGAEVAFEFLRELYGHQFPVVQVSAVTGTGLAELGEVIFAALDKVRVYLKAPGTQPDYDSPLVLSRGSAVADAAQSLHKDWNRKLRYAQLWGSGKFEGQRVGRDYVLLDGDVLELRA